MRGKLGCEKQERIKSSAALSVLPLQSIVKSVRFNLIIKNENGGLLGDLASVVHYFKIVNTQHIANLIDTINLCKKASNLF